MREPGASMMTAIDTLVPAPASAGTGRLDRARADFSHFSAICLQGEAARSALVRFSKNMVTATPFQSSFWLAHWLDAFATEQRTFLLVAVRRHGEETPSLLLPLCLSKEQRLTIISFADAGVTDYNAPLLRDGFAVVREEAAALLEAIQQALPPADVLMLDKMPHVLAGHVNPLVCLPGAHESRLHGNIVHPGDVFDDYIRGFHRKYRKEVGREKRVFENFEGAHFFVAQTMEDALPVMDALECIQEARMAELGRDYDLDESEKRAFYRKLLQDGLANGAVSLTALKVKDEVIAALFCINRGGHCAMVRIAQAGGAWSVCSPGRLIILETMRWLHGQQYRLFDFTIGAYEYKRRLGAAHVPLARVMVALSLRGQLAVTADSVLRCLRRSTLLRHAVRRLRGTAAQD